MASTTDQTLPDLRGTRIAIITSDYFEEVELTTPRDRLRAAGAEVLVYSLTGEPVQAMEGDVEQTITVDVDGALTELDDVALAALDALVVPGGTVNADHLRVDASAQRIVTAVLDAGKPVAAICHAPWLLVSAKLAAGRRLTSYPSLADDVRNAGGDWVDHEVVVDGSLITSRNPDDLPAFVGAIAQALRG